MCLESLFFHHNMARGFFDLLLLASLACLICLGVGRGVMLYARGVRLVVIDRERALAQSLCDLAQVLSLLFWAYAIVAFTWPLPSRLVASWLAAVLVDSVWAKSVGALLLLSGLVLYALALRAFGASWRLGIDRERPGPLVTTGVFAYTRNPIYVSLELLLIGAFLVQGRLIFLLLALANVVLFHALIRREERFLVDSYGSEYREYRARVGRYGPHFAGARDTDREH